MQNFFVHDSFGVGFGVSWEENPRIAAKLVKVLIGVLSIIWSNGKTLL
jgi:5-carboxymethyl-2-hydroxymuconate isomerase